MLEALKAIIFGIVEGITEWSADQRSTGASDLVGRITAFETKSGVS